MKKTIFSLFFIFFLTICITPKSTYASYAEAKGAYQTEYSQYRQILQDYKVARSEYLTYKTLASRTQAISTTRNFLTQRQQVLIKYVEMISQRLQELEGPYVTNEDIQPLLKASSQQSTWLQEQLPSIANASELEDLVAISKQIDSRIPQISGLSYQAQATIIVGRSKELHARSNDILAITSEQVRRISSEGKKNTTLIQRWLIDAEQKSKLATDTQLAGQTTISNINSSAGLDQVRETLSKAKQYIMETNNLLLEVISNIKVK